MRDRTAAPRAVDLSHEIVDGMITHPGIPGPMISTFLTHESSAARYAAHTAILDAGIPLVEHLTGLGSLPGMAFGSSRFRQGSGVWPPSRSGPSRS